MRTSVPASIRAAEANSCLHCASGLGVIYPTEKGKRKLTQIRVQGRLQSHSTAKAPSHQDAKKKVQDGRH